LAAERVDGGLADSPGVHQRIAPDKNGTDDGQPAGECPANGSLGDVDADPPEGLLDDPQAGLFDDDPSYPRAGPTERGIFRRGAAAGGGEGAVQRDTAFFPDFDGAGDVGRLFAALVTNNISLALMTLPYAFIALQRKIVRWSARVTAGVV